jgi:hypothetical protein
MRKEAKNKKRTKCELKGCMVETFKKNQGYYYKGKYYCGRTHARRDRYKVEDVT